MPPQPKQNCIIIILFFVIAIDTMGVSLAWPIFGSLFTGKTTTLFTSDISMQWRNILYGIIIGISSLFMFLGAPILGDISDRIGRRKVLLFCLLGTSFGMGLSILGIIFSQILLLMFSRAWLGTIAASQIIAQATIIDISTQENKASRLGVVSAANNIGFIIGPIIGGLLMDSGLVSWFGFTIPFYFAALLALLNASLLLVTYKETLNKYSLKPPKQLKQDPVAAGFSLRNIARSWQRRLKPAATIRSHQNLFTWVDLIFTNSVGVFIRALAHKKIRTLAFIYVCFQTGWALYLNTNFLILIQKYNYSGRLLGYFSLWMGFIFCLNLLIMVRIITRFVVLKKIIYSALFIAAVCCIAMIYSGEIGLWLVLFPMISAISLGGNAIVTSFSNIATETEQGWAIRLIS